MRCTEGCRSPHVYISDSLLIQISVLVAGRVAAGRVVADGAAAEAGCDKVTISSIIAQQRNAQDDLMDASFDLPSASINHGRKRNK